MAKKSNVQLGAEEYARKNEIRNRVENMEQLKAANDEKLFQTQCQEKELAMFEKFDACEFTFLNPTQEYENNETFLQYVKETKIEAFKRAIAKAHETMGKTAESIAKEEAKLSLLSQGINIGGLSDEEIVSRAN